MNYLLADDFIGIISCKRNIYIEFTKQFFACDRDVRPTVSVEIKAFIEILLASGCLYSYHVQIRRFNDRRKVVLS